MTEEVKLVLKQKFEKGKYNAFIYIIDNDLIKIDLDNYKSISTEVVNLFNEVRGNRDISYVECFYELDVAFGDSFYEAMSNAIKRNENLDELPEEVEEALNNYRTFIKAINSVGNTYTEEGNEKVK